MSRSSYFDKLTTGVTLTKYILVEQQSNPEKFGDLSRLMNAIQIGVKALSNLVRKSGFSQILGPRGSWYSQYYEQKLDQLAHELLVNTLVSSFSTCVLVSGEEEDVIIVEKDKQKSTGPASRRDVLDQSGRDVVAAGYALYGSATVFVMSAGNGVHEFILDPTIGEFILTSYSMRIPSAGRMYSINEGYSKYWYAPIQRYVRSLKYPKDGKDPYSGRYIGAMVADVHRTLKYGGIFMYPATKDCPRGKLRLMYECIPMAFLVEQAGGLAVTNPAGSLVNVLEVNAGSSVHQRIPVFMGSRGNVEEMIACFQCVMNGDCDDDDGGGGGSDGGGGSGRDGGGGSDGGDRWGIDRKK
ncbi:hypothetical protein HELRODRAFT_116769 [Helobdella robusta]|uniref:fructose-bisphosphatase n=1 Tax=Helobdella robusta TaxID=6412 RepID=T1EGH5_HELRO|nr:hypothetical protein HELRODRAFT_116769 [Helobdella robusta]ESN89845.1 hypothetical protein HELRODRAFT_116769 [Helobdella robusta]